MDNAVITKKGLALLAKLPQGTALEITSAKTGTGSVDISSLQDQTGVTSPKQTLTIQNVSHQEDGKCSLILSVTNDGVLSSYTIMQLGVFARDPDEGEILFSIYQANSGEGINIPSATILPGYSAEWSYNIKFDKADNVNVNVDPSNTVTRAAMEEYVGSAVKEAQKTLAKVASSGSYKDLSDQPTIPTIPSSLPANGGNADTVGGKRPDEFATKSELPALHVWDRYMTNPGQITETSVYSKKLSSTGGDIPYADSVTVIDGKIFIYGEQGVLVYETALSSRDASAILGKYIRAGDEIYYIPKTATFDFQGTELQLNNIRRLSTPVHIEFVCAYSIASYPSNGAHTDGYWYVYRGQFYEKPYTYGPEDLEAGASPLQDGKLYLVYE